MAVTEIFLEEGSHNGHKEFAMQIVTHDNENQELVGQFDYSGYDAETIELGQKTAQVASIYMQFKRRTKDKGLELGEHLAEMKNRLRHGEYMPYVASIGVPHQDAVYWTRKVREIAEGQINDINNLTFTDVEEQPQQKRIVRPDMALMFGDDDEDEPDTGNDTSNGSHEPPLERVVPGTVTAPEMHEPRTIQRGNGQLREAKQEYNKLEGYDKPEAMARAKPEIEDAPRYTATRIKKSDIGDRKDYIGDEFLIDCIGDLMEQARDKGYSQALRDMFYARGFFQRKVAV